ncbi:MAG TPA: tetratricopeptide repeat protein [Clostridiaceae bacterium]|nr:tetratricopeptide repeat protein [Clostridiaceae bacterium]
MNNNIKKLLINFVLPAAAIVILFRRYFLYGIIALILYILYGLYIGKASIYTIIGSIRYSKGNMEEAIKWLDKAYKSGRAKPTTITSYAYLLLKSGNIQEAEKILMEQMDKILSDDDKMNVKSNLALVLWKKGQLDEAINMLEEVFSKYKTTTIYGSLGYLLILKGDLNKALEFNLEAYEYNSSNAVIQDNLGQTYFLLGDYDKSQEIYEKLISTNPSFPEAYYNYGLLLKQKGETDKALEYMKKALNYKFSFLSTVSREEVEAVINKISG